MTTTAVMVDKREQLSFTVDPSLDFYDPPQKRTPAQTLAYKMVERGLLDLELAKKTTIRHITIWEQRELHRAKYWFKYPQYPTIEQGGLSLAWCCEALNWDLDYIVELALKGQ